MSRAVGIGLFVVLQALYALTSSWNAFRIPDEFEVYFQTEHLIDAGDLSVPQAQEIKQPVSQREGGCDLVHLLRPCRDGRQGVCAVRSVGSGPRGAAPSGGAGAGVDAGHRMVAARQRAGLGHLRRRRDHAGHSHGRRRLRSWVSIGPRSRSGHRREWRCCCRRGSGAMRTPGWSKRDRVGGRGAPDPRVPRPELTLSPRGTLSRDRSASLSAPVRGRRGAPRR